MKTIFTDCSLVLPDQMLPEGAVIVGEDGKIAWCGKESDLPSFEGKVIDLGGKLLSPGLIDIHVHGGKGITFGENDVSATTAFYSNWVVENSVTGYLMTIADATHDGLVDMLHKYVDVLSHPVEGAETLGLHLEGPYLNIEKKGAFNPAWLRNPSVEEAKAYIQAGQGWIRQITMAPELPNATEVAHLFREAGVVVAMGHTNNSYEGAEAALKGDFNHVTHTFNAQRGFDHRSPGVFGAVMTSDIVTGELIADTIHVHPGAMKLLMRTLGTDRVVAITDAMSGAGLPEGVYHLVGHDVFVKDGRATLENGTLAGSIATLNMCVNNLVKTVGVSIYEAVKMASLNPARVIGVSDRLGSIAIGKDASLVVFDDNFHTALTMVKGKIVYRQI